MKISPRKYAEALLGALDGTPKNKAEFYLDNFLKIIERNNDVKILLDIVKELEKIGRESAGLKNVTITTTTALSEEAVKEIVQKLEKVFSSKIEIRREVKPDILGGVVIESGEDYFDKSLKSHINKFKYLITN